MMENKQNGIRGCLAWLTLGVWFLFIIIDLKLTTIKWSKRYKEKKPVFSNATNQDC